MYVVHVHLPLNNVGHNHCYNVHVHVFFSSEGKGNLVGQAKAKLKCFIEEDEAKLDFPRNGERGFIHVHVRNLLWGRYI